MSSTRGHDRIVVGNSMVDGVNQGDELPTFMLNVLGMTHDAIETQLTEVAILQALAPVFRVMVLTEWPIFSLVRGYGWPVEHVPAREHGVRELTSRGLARYTHMRVAIAQSHFHDLTVLSGLGPASLTESIAAAIGHPELVGTVRRLAGGPPVRSGVRTDWSSIRADLAEAGRSCYEGVEGSAVMTLSGPEQPSILIVGATDAPTLQLPGWVATIRVEFSRDASLAFESYVYSTLALEVGQDLAVVLPWRPASLLESDVLRSIDLGLSADFHEGPRVRREYAQHYVDLAGTDELRWNAARAYGAVRRLVRGSA